VIVERVQNITFMLIYSAHPERTIINKHEKMLTFISSLKEVSKLRNSASESEPFLTSTMAAFDFRRISRPFLSSLLKTCSTFSSWLLRVLYGIFIAFFLDSEELASNFLEELKMASFEIN
jgi:hypothetical protein